MNVQLKALLSLLFLLLFIQPGRSSDFGSWEQFTSYGSKLFRAKTPDGYTTGIRCKHTSAYRSKPVITGINRYYLYKNNIIGTANSSGQSFFFVYDESSCDLSSFPMEAEFSSYLKSAKLQPTLWTRWYEKNWGYFIPSGHFGDKLTFTYIKLPLLILLGLTTLIGLTRTRFRLRHTFNIATLTITGIVLIRIVLDHYPASI